jgi:hypothetical protein
VGKQVIKQVTSGFKLSNLANIFEDKDFKTRK